MSRQRLSRESCNAIDTFLQDMDVTEWICHDCPYNTERPAEYYTPNGNGYPAEDACPVDRCPDDLGCAKHDRYEDLVKDIEFHFELLEDEWRRIG